LKKRIGLHAVDCLGTGFTQIDSQRRAFAVQERAAGSSLTEYQKLGSVIEALSVLEQLLSAMIDMTKDV